MILIYGKGKVGQALGTFCTYMDIEHDICDDADGDIAYDRYDIIIPSPGIPGFHEIYTTGKVVSELDFISRYLPKGFQTIVITGTDGKSTTSWIMYSILEKEYFGKKSVYLSGNFDIPFSSTVLDILKNKIKKGYIVIEVSSFMAHSLHEFSPDYAIFTNFKPDHLNWHRTLQEYLDAKMHLLSRAKQYVVINRQVLDFADTHQLDMLLPAHVRIFENALSGYDSTDGEVIRISGRKKYLLSETQFSGIHNAMNILSSGLIANLMKICSKRTRKYLSEIRGLPHRLELIGNKDGVMFVEDSKSTSSQSLEAALGSYGNHKNLLLIVGGSDKGDSFEHLAPLFRKRIKVLACMGDTKNQFIEIAKKENIPYISTDTMSEAISYLLDVSRSGDVLMLSPGCASFGLYRDYLHRAEVFREAIKKLQ